MNLKSKTKGADGFPAEFAYLIEPSAPVKNNDELYAAVHANGRAVLRPFEGFGYKLKRAVSVEPAEFERQWEGD